VFLYNRRVFILHLLLDAFTICAFTLALKYYNLVLEFVVFESKGLFDLPQMIELIIVLINRLLEK